MANTYYHHFFARGCELAGCDAPERNCDLYLVDFGKRGIHACCGAHAEACADLDAWLDARPEVPEPEPGLDGDDAWARCEACGELTEPRELEEWNGICARCREEAR